MNLLRQTSPRIFLVLPLVLGFFFLVSLAPAYAAGLGESCGWYTACDKPYVCTADKCAIDLTKNPSGAPVNSPNAPVNSGGASDSGSGGLQNPLNNISSLPQLLDAIIGGIVEIGSIFLVLMLVYVGFLFVAARGNQEKIQSARSALVWTVIGGLILLGAAAIKAVIVATASTL